MFDRIKGVRIGVKVAGEVSKATKEIVNWITTERRPIVTHDTLVIFRECYCYCLLQSFRENNTPEYLGAVSVTAKENLEEWLLEATQVLDLTELFEGLDSYFQEWAKSLFETKEGIEVRGENDKELTGIEKFKTVANLDLVYNLDDYFRDKYGEEDEPDSVSSGELRVLVGEVADRIHKSLNK